MTIKQELLSRIKDNPDEWGPVNKGQLALYELAIDLTLEKVNKINKKEWKESRKFLDKVWDNLDKYEDCMIIPKSCLAGFKDDIRKKERDKVRYVIDGEISEKDKILNKELTWIETHKALSPKAIRYSVEINALKDLKQALTSEGQKQESKQIDDPQFCPHVWKTGEMELPPGYLSFSGVDIVGEWELRQCTLCKGTIKVYLEDENKI